MGRLERFDSLHRRLRNANSWVINTEDNSAYKLAYRTLGEVVLRIKHFQIGKPIERVSKTEITGPAIIASTHHEWEWFAIQRAVPNYIHWISDPTYPWNNYKRLFDHWLFGPFLRKAGQLNVDRRRPLIGLREILDSSLRIIEEGGLAWIAQKAQEMLRKDVPIYPIALREGEDSYELVFGDPLFLNGWNRKEFTLKLLYHLEGLAGNSTSLPALWELRRRQKERREMYNELRRELGGKGRDITLHVYYTEIIGKT